jgi:predicted SAM-dependent methyltransferase
MTVEFFDWSAWFLSEGKYGRILPWLDLEREKDPDFRKANLGCGTKVFNPDHGWVNVDQFGDPDHSIIQWDLARFPYPFEDDYFDFIFMSNILEHIPQSHPDVLGELWYSLEQELFRITKPGGLWEIHGPDPRNVIIELQRGGHCRLVGPVTFEHLVVKYHYGALQSARMHENLSLKRVDHTDKKWPAWYGFNIMGLTDWHCRRYLGRRLGDLVARILGKPCQLRMVYQVVK